MGLTCRDPPEINVLNKKNSKIIINSIEGACYLFDSLKCTFLTSSGNILYLLWLPWCPEDQKKPEQNQI